MMSTVTFVNVKDQQIQLCISIEHSCYIPLYSLFTIRFVIFRHPDLEYNAFS